MLQYRPYFGDECLMQKINLEVKIQKSKLENIDSLLTMVHSLWSIDYGLLKVVIVTFAVLFHPLFEELSAQVPDRNEMFRSEGFKKSDKMKVICRDKLFIQGTVQYLPVVFSFI